MPVPAGGVGADVSRFRRNCCIRRQGAVVGKVLRLDAWAVGADVVRVVYWLEGTHVRVAGY